MIDRYLGGYSPYIYALLRIVSGFLFLLHGTQKFFGFPASGKPPMPLAAMMTAGAIEIVAGLMIMFGLFASLAAFGKCFTLTFLVFLSRFKGQQKSVAFV